jgi:hypothetical protein
VDVGRPFLQSCSKQFVEGHTLFISEFNSHGCSRRGLRSGLGFVGRGLAAP